MTTTRQRDKLANLADYVRAHGWPAEIRGDEVWGWSSWSSLAPDGSVASGWEWQRAGSTLAEVRAWLGY